jgi:hypothetical protein
VEGEEEAVIEFEAGRELTQHLVGAVEELGKDGRSLAQAVRAKGEAFLHARQERRLRRLGYIAGRDGKVGAIADKVPGPVGKLVAEREPVLLDQDGEAFDGAVVRVEAELGERGELRGPVPAVGAVDEDVRIGEMDVSGDENGAVEEGGDVLEPAGSSQGVAIDEPRQLRLAQGCVLL